MNNLRRGFKISLMKNSKIFVNIIISRKMSNAEEQMFPLPLYDDYFI